MAKMKKDIDPLLAERLRHLISFSGLSQKEFAFLIGKTTRTVSAWLSKKTPFSPSVFVKTIDGFRKHNVDCSQRWLLTGEGEGPQWVGKKYTGEKETSEKIFDHFNLDYTFSVLTEFFRQSYPNAIHLFVQDETYSSRIKPQTLLIAVGMGQDKYRDNWEFGYLLKKSEYRVIPVDVVRKDGRLFATPFPIEGFKSLEIALEPHQEIYPIINIRPLY